jgi:hypothetical protein
MALRSGFGAEAARGTRAGYELRLGEVVVHARVDDGVLEVGEGPLAGADLVLETGTELRRLMAGEITPVEAVESGAVRVTGDPVLLDRFAEIFHIAPAPAAFPS